MNEIPGTGKRGRTTPSFKFHENLTAECLVQSVDEFIEVRAKMQTDQLRPVCHWELNAMRRNSISSHSQWTRKCMCAAFFSYRLLMGIDALHIPTIAGRWRPSTWYGLLRILFLLSRFLSPMPIVKIVWLEPSQMCLRHRKVASRRRDML